MGWYDWFAHTYDLQLEGLYRPWREQLFARLSVPPDARVLDLGCGTGQNLPFLARACPDGQIVGVDLSAGMLAKARARAAREGLHVDLIQADLLELDALELGSFDLVIETVVLTAVPDWKRAFRLGFQHLRPGGCFAMLNVHARERTFHTWLVELLARADLDRTVWTELEAMAVDYEHIVLDASPRTFGGELFLATGRRPSPTGSAGT